MERKEGRKEGQEGKLKERMERFRVGEAINQNSTRKQGIGDHHGVKRMWRRNGGGERYGKGE